MEENNESHNRKRKYWEDQFNRIVVEPNGRISTLRLEVLLKRVGHHDADITLEQFIAMMELMPSGGDTASSSSKRPRVIGMAPTMTAIPTSGSVEFPPPTPEEKAAATEAAANRGCPALPAGLEWGYFENKPKKKNFFIWCAACGVYVAIMKGNAQNNVFEMSSDGRCTHWRPAVEENYRATARQKLLGEVFQ